MPFLRRKREGRFIWQAQARVDLATYAKWIASQISIAKIDLAGYDILIGSQIL
jgi:hypothetical protein